MSNTEFSSDAIYSNIRLACVSVCGVCVSVWGEGISIFTQQIPSSNGFYLENILQETL